MCNTINLYWQTNKHWHLFLCNICNTQALNVNFFPWFAACFSLTADGAPYCESPELKPGLGGWAVKLHVPTSTLQILHKLAIQASVMPCSSSHQRPHQGALVFKSGYHAQVQKHKKRVVFSWRSMFYRAMFRVSKTATINKRAFFRPIKNAMRVCLFCYNKYVIRVAYSHVHYMDTMTLIFGLKLAKSGSFFMALCSKVRVWFGTHILD